MTSLGSRSAYARVILALARQKHRGRSLIAADIPAYFAFCVTLTKIPYLSDKERDRAYVLRKYIPSIVDVYIRARALRSVSRKGPVVNDR